MKNFYKKNLDILKINPFPYLCYVVIIAKIFKTIFYLCFRDNFFTPIILWDVITVILYCILCFFLKYKHRYILHFFYIIETCSRIVFATNTASCDAQYELLIVSLFLTNLIINPSKQSKIFYSIFIFLVCSCLYYSFNYKYKFHRAFFLLTNFQQTFLLTELFTNLIITAFHMAIIIYVLTKRLNRMSRKNFLTQKKLEYIRSHDMLTSLMNRYRAQTFLSLCEIEKTNENTEYAIAILDIDDFKKINDTYGHDCGDFILKSYTQELRKKLPIENKIARWGGEEFLIIFPRITDETIYDLDNIRQLISITPFIYNGILIKVTATYGISSSRNFESSYDVLTDADNHLLIGKQNGKNRLVVSKNF